MTRLLRRGLLAAALVLFGAAAADAHDPGLSGLDIRVGAIGITADLSFAGADADAVEDLAGLAVEALDVRIDAVRLPGSAGPVIRERDRGVRVRVTYAARDGSVLTVRSRVPQSMAPGHRQLLSVHDADGALLAEQMLDATGAEASVDLRGARGIGRAAAARRFFTLGVEHIVGGYDHLLFLAGLLVVVRTRRDVVRTVTAFTVAHSLTLAAAVLGIASLPPAVVEPLIAGSLVYVGIENIVRRDVAQRARLTFGFGLVHGFGFAGALAESGIAAGAAAVVPLASFNLGVEAGQIAVAAAALPPLRLLTAQARLGSRVPLACSLAVAAAGTYWLFERTLLA